MPQPFTIPKFPKGQPVSDPEFRKNLNRIRAGARRAMALPGTFVNGEYVLQAPLPGGGDIAASAIVGSIAHVTDEIAAATEMAFSALPADVQTAAGAVPGASLCLKCGKGNAQVLQMILGSDGFIYAVPLPEDEELVLHNTSTSGTITDGDFVQYKNVEIEGENHGLIDVAPCTS